MSPPQPAPPGQALSRLRRACLLVPDLLRSHALSCGPTGSSGTCDLGPQEASSAWKATCCPQVWEKLEPGLRLGCHWPGSSGDPQSQRARHRSARPPLLRPLGNGPQRPCLLRGPEEDSAQCGLSGHEAGETWGQRAP